MRVHELLEAQDDNPHAVFNFWFYHGYPEYTDEEIIADFYNIDAFRDPEVSEKLFQIKVNHGPALAEPARHNQWASLKISSRLNNLHALMLAMASFGSNVDELELRVDYDGFPWDLWDSIHKKVTEAAVIETRIIPWDDMNNFDKVTLEERLKEFDILARIKKGKPVGYNAHHNYSYASGNPHLYEVQSSPRAFNRWDESVKNTIDRILTQNGYRYRKNTQAVVSRVSASTTDPQLVEVLSTFNYAILTSSMKRGTAAASGFIEKVRLQDALLCNGILASYTHPTIFFDAVTDDIDKFSGI